MYRRRGEREAAHRDTGLDKKGDIALDRAAQGDAHQHAAVRERRPAPHHIVLAVGMERIELEPDGALDILGGHTGQGNLAHDDFAARQQHRGAEAFRARCLQEARVLGAPLGRGTRGIVFDGQTAQHLNLVGTHSRDRDFKIRGADFQTYAGAEGEQLAEVFGDGKIQGHRTNCSTSRRTSAGSVWGWSNWQACT